MKNRTCFYCGLPNGSGARELRPYGPDGVDICAECTFSDPDKEAKAAEEFKRRLNAADKVTHVSILTHEGPLPYIGRIPHE